MFDEEEMGLPSPAPGSSNFDKSCLQLAMDPLKCPRCSSTFNELKLLEAHTSKYHVDVTEDELTRVVEELGLISCRICGTFRERTQGSINMHLKSIHNMTMFDYFGKIGPEAGRQNEEDKRVSEALRNARCPSCPPATDSRHFFKGVRTFRKHLREAHGFKKRLLYLTSLLTEFADQLGVVKCDRCLVVVAKNFSFEEHILNCKKVRQMKQLYSSADSKNELHLYCHLCKLKVTCAASLKKHMISRHNVSEEEFLQLELKISADTGVSCCRLCGSLRERQYSPIDNHLNQCHKIKLSKYSQEFGQDFYQLTPDEIRLSEAVKRLPCPICKTTENLGSIKALQLHMQNNHGVMVWPTTIIMLSADALGGLVKCRSCKTAVLKEMEETHARLCGMYNNRRGGIAPLPLDNQVLNQSLQEDAISLSSVRDKRDEGSNAANISDDFIGDDESDYAGPNADFGHDNVVQEKESGEVDPAMSTKLCCPLCQAVCAHKIGFLSHVKKHHRGENPHDSYERSILKNGICACKCCGTVRRHVLKELESHLRSHDLEVKGYADKFGPEAFQLDEDEVFASNILRNISCPECDKTDISGTDQFKKHMKASHNVILNYFPKVLSPLLQQLGLKECETCKQIIFPRYEQVHQKSCSKRGRRRANDSTESLELMDQGEEEGESRFKRKRSLNDISREGLQDEGFHEDDEGRKSPSVASVASSGSKSLTSDGKAQATDSDATGNAVEDKDSKLEARKASLMLPCLWCPGKMGTVTALTDHVWEKHKEGHSSTWLLKVLESVGTHPCALCGDSVRRDCGSIEDHLRVHHEKVSLDNYVMGNWTSLSAGRGEAGGGKREYSLIVRQCPWCGEAFKSRDKLREHAKVKHVSADLQILDNMEEPLRNMIHQCSLCRLSLNLEYESIQQHVKESHNFMMERYLEMFYKEIQRQVEDQWKERKSRARLFRDPPKPIVTPQSKDDDDDVMVVEADCEVKRESRSKMRKGKQRAITLVDLDDGDGNGGGGSVCGGAGGSSGTGPSSLSNSSPSISDSSMLESASQFKQEGHDDAADDGLANVVDACKYVCPRCKTGPFHSLLAITGHVKRRHKGDLGLLLSLKQARVVERKTECKICHEVVILDQVELGYHVWAMHGMPIDAYVKLHS